MAFTVTVESDNVIGNKRAQVWLVSADGGEANLTSGFQRLDFVSFQPVAGQTMPVARLNQNSSGTSAQGTLGVSGTSNGNSFRALVLGT